MTDHYQFKHKEYSLFDDREDDFSFDLRVTNKPHISTSKIDFQLIGDTVYNGKGCGRFAPMNMDFLATGAS